MAKKSAKTSSAKSPGKGGRQRRTFSAIAGEDPDNNPKVPLGGLSLRSHSDGTFAVSSADHTVTLGTPSAQAKPPGRRGGIVVAGVRADGGLPPGTIPVRDADELMVRLKSAVSTANVARAAGRSQLKDLHFSLKGQHTLDLGQLSAIAGGYSSSLLAHIHIATDDNPQVPPGG